MSRFAKALGIWEIELCDPKLELKPTMADVKLFRNVLLQHSKNKSVLFDKFSDFMWQLVNKEHPEDCQVKDENGDNEVKVWIEVNINALLEEAMISFKWTTKDELEKSKTESLQEIKKVMSND